MERKQNDNQNQNQNPQSFDHNSNDSNSSSSTSNYGYTYLHNNEPRNFGDYRGLPRSSTQVFLQRPNPDSLFQNTMFGLGRLRIKRNDSERNSSNNLIIGGEGVNSVQNQMPNVEIQENLIDGSDYVSKCAMTIRGCEHLQRILAAEDGGLRETIITKVAADLPILMVHKIGCQFATALFESCDEHQMSRVLQSVLVGNELVFVYICNNYFGREAVKALIHNFKIEAQLLIVTNVLEAHICSFTNYTHGQNVLEFFIYTYNHNFSRMRIFNAMANKCLAIATNRLGCVVLQHFICPVFIQGGLISSLLDAIVVNSPILAGDKYGNYLIQHVVDSNIEDVTKCIVGALIERLSELAKSKIGSIVVQKCLVKCEQMELVKIVVEFTNSSQLLSIAQDPFGNYVLQCALEQLFTWGSVEHYGNLVKGINVHYSTLQGHLYGSKVIQKIHQLNYKFSFHNKLVYWPKSIFPL